jgi:hypothetical protein
VIALSYRVNASEADTCEAYVEPDDTIVIKGYIRRGSGALKPLTLRCYVATHGREPPGPMLLPLFRRSPETWQIPNAPIFVDESPMPVWIVGVPENVSNAWARGT